MKNWQTKLLKRFNKKSILPFEDEEDLIQQAVKHKSQWIGLDAGCGRRSNLGKSAAQQSLVIGIDRDWEALLANNDIDVGIICTLTDLPFKNEIFDVIHCGFVIEHLDEPGQVFKEYKRITKPNGFLTIWTVNLMNYVMLASKLTPTSFHNIFRKHILKTEHDNVPTYYRANTPWKLEKMLGRQGFEKQNSLLRGGAFWYFKFSRLTFFVSLLLDKFTDFGFLKNFRLFILGIYKKVGQ
jgi:ubiquinone/menaquinone biosynthesis C-methylase UbiE